MIKIFYIIFFALAGVQFAFSSYYFYLSGQKLRTIPKGSTAKLGSFIKTNAPLFTQDNYNFNDVVNVLKDLIKSLNTTNKGSYIATAIVTIFSGIITLISGFILYFNF